MRLLSIETSCDETSAAVVEKKGQYISLLSNSTSSSARIHAQTGGIIPEEAARAQINAIIPVINEALLNSERVRAKSPEEEYKIAQEILSQKIQGIAVTSGPGLIGSLLVGIETAKTLAFVTKKPLYQVNHLLGHLYANFLVDDTNTKNIEFPFIGLIVSGGHTDLLFFESHAKYKWLGGTRDDAAGEALDKIGRMLNIQYPAGSEIEKKAEQNTNSTLHFQSPLLHDKSYDFSFSGLKTEVMRYVKNNNLDENLINSVCDATQNAVIKVIIKKTLKAMMEYNTSRVLIGGGVAANAKLRNSLKEEAKNNNIPLMLFAPSPSLCADNAAMIGARALLAEQPVPWQKVTPQPELYFST